jgi:hypothetical protein
MKKPGRLRAQMPGPKSRNYLTNVGDSSLTAPRSQVLHRRM